VTAPRRLHWSTATLKDGDLTVEFAGQGEPTPQWDESFEEALSWMMRETRGGVWGKVWRQPGRIRVDGLQDGSEDALKQFLNDAVRRANEGEERKLRETEAALAENKAQKEQRRKADAKMQTRLRDKG
jgi:hypothetical protein